MNEIGQDKNHYIITVVLLNYNLIYMVCISIFIPVFLDHRRLMFEGVTYFIKTWIR